MRRDRFFFHGSLGASNSTVRIRVFGRSIELVILVYKPTNITGGHRRAIAANSCGNGKYLPVIKRGNGKSTISIGYFPIHISIHRGFSTAMFD